MKARLCARGYREIWGQDYVETHASVTCLIYKQFSAVSAVYGFNLRLHSVQLLHATFGAILQPPKVSCNRQRLQRYFETQIYRLRLQTKVIIETSVQKQLRRVPAFLACLHCKRK